MGLAENIKEVNQKIRQAAQLTGRDAGDIKLVAVTKDVEPARIIEAVGTGISTFGENYAQEFRDKHLKVEEACGREVKWHYIGILQSNKVKYLLGKVELIHSLDRLSSAEEIEKRGKRENIKMPVLVQVNMGEKQKGGVKPEKLEGFLKKLEKLSNVGVKGLMGIPPFFNQPERARPYFRKLRELRDKFREKYPDMSELSMGMSGDFKVAIEEGATIIRVGTAIFGPRE